MNSLRSRVASTVPVELVSNTRKSPAALPVSRSQVLHRRRVLEVVVEPPHSRFVARAVTILQQEGLVVALWSVVAYLAIAYVGYRWGGSLAHPRYFAGR